jgi:hypothetical protein
MTQRQRLSPATEPERRRGRRLQAQLALISLELNTLQGGANLTDLTSGVLDSTEVLLSRPTSAEYLRLVRELRDLYPDKHDKRARARSGAE